MVPITACMSDSIYGAAERRRAYTPAPKPRPATLHTPLTIASSCDAHLAGILEALLHAGEPTSVAFARRERELAAAFAALPISARPALHARLAKPAPGDILAEKLGRLIAERRIRLLALIGRRAK